MKLSFCTISFRHHLFSIHELVEWASKCGFQGVEMWGIHAKHLVEEGWNNHNLFNDNGLPVSMISGYVPFTDSFDVMKEHIADLSLLGKTFNSSKLRVFAGQIGSEKVTPEMYKEVTQQLKFAAQYVHQYGQQLVIETHPSTLADSVPATLRLIEEVDHPALRINFDALHVWESGCDVVEAFLKLKPFISHVHLKNISSRNQLSVFEPNNVYAAYGSRVGMTHLFEGAVDYSTLLPLIRDLDASLEWFGPKPKEVLSIDSQLVYKELSVLEVV
ncbi:sugar phosphate isomerase/epimerase family protein [Bacillus suaedaesalsae]|uniref:Sugar phosphate isomerase/epimerase n=1 Tax=Bacillus suaedaesalsae TaxID=2810349 RepID=A0ABS2DKB6_9BACI|nr:sugar phosphate isomerase/epimerase family protein [Bacillus suaedaesalsae]MBM6618934.1 sugar phosphate isomerase/epimerase [Bacillus suaedaesalsae]